MIVLFLLLVSSALFVVTHLGLSHGRIREGLVARWGIWGFRAVYSAVSLATLGPAVALFWTHRGFGPRLWHLPGWLALALAIPLVLLAVELVVLMLAAPSPAGMLPAPAEPRGVLRITRHPLNMGVAAFALAHLLANAALGDVALFGALFAVGFFGAYHQDRRKRRELGGAYEAFWAQTSVLPFAAVVRGRAALRAPDLPLPMVLLGAVLFAALFVFHGTLFGVSLLS